MRRAVARGRVFPQSYSTDRRYGRLSLKACALFPLMWANADDQGRLPGDPEEIKYATCPNIDHITKADIPELLKELDKNELIKLYNTSKTDAIQILDWWDVHRPQWAWPSQYPPPEGWQDHLRYKRGAKVVVKENWFSQVSENNASGEQEPHTQVSHEIVSGEPPVGVKERERSQEKEIETERRKGKRKPKEEEEIHLRAKMRSGEEIPSPTVSPVKLLNKLTECYRIGWGTIRAEEPDKVIPRPPDARIDAQMRDLANELSSAGGCPLEYVDQAFKEAAGQQKYHISYVRAILLDWLGIPREHHNEEIEKRGRSPPY